MPFTADYICDQCDHRWEAWLKNSADAPDQCPECGSTNMRRVPGGAVTKCHDPQVRSEVLKKRSLDHTKRTAKDNIARIIDTGK